MSSLDERTKIPLGWAIGIVMTILTTVGQAAVSHYKISLHDDEIKEIKSDMKEKAKADAERDLSLKEISGKLDSLDEKLDDKMSEVKESVDKLDRRLSRENNRR